MSKKMGRPEVPIDEEQLRTLMRLKPSIADCAAFFRCCNSKIEKYIREHFDKTFSEFRDENMVHTRFMLIRTALEKAKKGDNIMLIFCLKNLCGWMDQNKTISEVKAIPYGGYDPTRKLNADV